jgi:hypothetical protein
MQRLGVGSQRKEPTMRIRVQSYNGTRGDERFVKDIERSVEGNLSRFGQRISNVDVLIVDDSEHPNDKQCFVEAKLTGWDPIAVRAHARTFERAVEAGAEKIGSAIEERDHRTDDPDRLSPLD